MRNKSITELELITQRSQKILQSTKIDPEIAEEIINYVRASNYHMTHYISDDQYLELCQELKGLFWQGKMTLIDYERRTCTLAEVRNLIFLTLLPLLSSLLNAYTHS